ncbi:UNKNOWN [Stylonychia lemnae]|uniref:Uncharacterized protein n=1 Tax=Stylonychia lemnae TaxID=5949 RepID=A0A078A7C0_STYLE|nr:UNKNOWN [Stylonychia lemnae]|eukprot:CDW78144.1 UNKNOWN [Stylonychia lemnae]
MLKRINDQNSTYNLHDWLDSRLEQEKLLSKICQYPHQFSTQRSKVNFSDDRSQKMKTQYSNLSKLKNVEHKSVDPSNGEDREDSYMILPLINQTRLRTIDPEPDVDRYSLLNDTNSIERSESDARLLDQAKLKFTKKQRPMKVSGRKLIDDDRKVLWKQNKKIADDEFESTIEISKAKNKFYVVQFIPEFNKYNVIEMFKIQGKKLMNACQNSYEKLMDLLQYKYDKLVISDFYDLLLSNEYQGSTNISLNPLNDVKVLKLSNMKQSRPKINSSLEFVSNNSSTANNSPKNDQEQSILPNKLPQSKKFINVTTIKKPVFPKNAKSIDISRELEKSDIIQVKLKVPDFEFIDSISPDQFLPPVSKLMNNSFVVESQRYGNMLTKNIAKDNTLVLTSVREEEITDQEDSMSLNYYDTAGRNTNDTQQNAQGQVSGSQLLKDPRHSSEYSFYADQDDSKETL